VTTGPIANKWVFLAVACAAVVPSFTTWFAATAILPELVVRWRLDPNGASWLTNGVQAGFVTGALVMSMTGLPDRVAPQRLMTLAAAIAGLSTLGLLLEPGTGAAIALRFVTGAALAGVYPPSMKLMATWFRAGRGLALGFLVGALTLGSAMPHLIRALGANLDWQAVLVASGAFSIASAAIAALLLREGPYPFAPGAKVDLRQVGAILRNRPVMAANLGYFGHMWELYAMWGWFLAFGRAAAETGLQLANPSLLAFVAIAIGVAGCIFGGMLADRIGRSHATALAMVVSGSCAVGIGFVFTGPLWLLVAVALIWGFFVIADSAQFSAAVTELAPPEIVGSALAFQMGVGFALTIVSVWAVPLLAGVVGWQWVFLVLAPGPFLGAWAMLALRRMPEAERMAGGRR